MQHNSVVQALAENDTLILDGALATELKARLQSGGRALVGKGADGKPRANSPPGGASPLPPATRRRRRASPLAGWLSSAAIGRAAGDGIGRAVQRLSRQRRGVSRQLKRR